MAHPSEMVGELSIIATTKTLRRPIRIMTSNGAVKYGDAIVNSEPFTVWFTKLGEDVGHYDCVIPTHVNAIPVLSVTPRVGFSLPEPIIKENNRRSNRSELITSSSYKAQLEKKNMGVKPNTNSSDVKKRLKSQSKPKRRQAKKSTTARDGKLSPSSGCWFRFICAEDIQEDMIKGPVRSTDV